MKLLFPNGEHAAVELAEGITRVGSGSQSHVVLVAPGVSENHCEIEVRNGKTSVRVRDQGVATVLNGRQIAQESPLKAGDLLLFGRIGCRVVASERDVTPVAPTPAAAVSEEDGRTRVRMALPKFMLRGVSGATFGRNFALVGTMTIGRQSDCGIPIPAEEISRHHARLQVTADGVMVEDLGSANGTWINDKRVHTGMLNPGDELRLDTVRFLLLAPGMQAPATPSSAPVQEEAVPAAQSGSAVGWIIGGVVVVGVLVVGALKLLGVF
ncbi:MAG: FHA domain-containing protein [Dokdonella sp.]|jgi:pSer/pThr/pTyr-binding forkhead associated (FHA) protein|uniref:FHA domain-containing protein n=1 Tax=Dokdonella sp. TaxID=2291710 RepID=UPI001B4D8701|nr:FHA domain-containing protein [Dokdonella sp.]MBK8122637.1 FHA domain-containing protein [Dokdonella sp.]MBP6325673.1 FHA domain-containing protein [Dokdonella sp.]MBP6328596.1 FHA domain-containing protein [Dokdonella sp.]HNV08113.1 FHA domain-containing protein [Dokdonella sp.]HQV48174.1 FHA domain-containing protein [Dokdonella sp.]